MKDREKEIQHRRYEIVEEMKQLKKELIMLRQEENELRGEAKIKKKGSKQYGNQNI